MAQQSCCYLRTIVQLFAMPIVPYPRKLKCVRWLVRESETEILRICHLQFKWPEPEETGGRDITRYQALMSRPNSSVTAALPAVRALCIALSLFQIRHTSDAEADSEVLAGP